MPPRNPPLISAIQKARRRYTWTPFRIAALGVCLSHVNDLFYQSYRTQRHYPLYRWLMGRVRQQCPGLLPAIGLKRLEVVGVPRLHYTRHNHTARERT